MFYQFSETGCEYFIPLQEVEDVPTKPTGPKYRDNKGNPFKCLKDNCKGNRVRGTAFCKKCLEELKAKK